MSSLIWRHKHYDKFVQLFIPDLKHMDQNEYHKFQNFIYVLQIRVTCKGSIYGYQII